MKVIRGAGKYTWQDYKTNENILSELNIDPLVKKIQNYRNKWVERVRRMDTDQLPHLVMKYQQRGKLRTIPQKISRLIVGTKQITRSKTMEAA
jgi:hypothetical protein